MYFKLKKTSLLILGLTSLALSRGMFWFFDDPEGPNLLVVIVTAGTIFSLSLLLPSFYHSSSLDKNGKYDKSSDECLKSFLPIIIIQILIVIGLYFLLKFI